jgi:hypothetical protein
LAALLTITPLVNMVNCLLCGWLWISGIFAVWLYRANTGDAIDSRAGIALGAVTGLFGAAVSLLLGAFTGGYSTAIPAEQMQQLEKMMGESARIFTNPATLVLITAIFNFITYPIFGIAGGLIGASIFKNRPAAG